MSTLSKPHTFSPNTTISSSQVNSNFDTLYNDYNGGIDASNLASSAVTTAKIADLAVTAGKLAAASVTADKLALGVLQSNVATDEATTSTSYTDLATVQAVTVTIGANGMALAIYAMGMYNVAAAKRVSVAVSGASTVAANDSWCLRNDANAFTASQERSYLFTGLTAGSNTFTLKFKTASGTGRFFDRNLIVIPL